MPLQAIIVAVIVPWLLVVHDRAEAGRDVVWHIKDTGVMRWRDASRYVYSDGIRRGPRDARGVSCDRWRNARLRRDQFVLAYDLVWLDAHWPAQRPKADLREARRAALAKTYVVISGARSSPLRQIPEYWPYAAIGPMLEAIDTCRVPDRVGAARRLFLPH